LKFIGSNPISIVTTITGLIVVVAPLVDQYQRGTLAPWMLVAGLAGAVFARLTDEDWAGKVSRRDPPSGYPSANNLEA
jgi:hypothetical protein